MKKIIAIMSVMAFLSACSTMPDLKNEKKINEVYVTPFFVMPKTTDKK